MKPFFSSLGFHCYDCADTEGDDVMATLSKYAVDRRVAACVVLVTPDKDMMQLVQNPVAAPTGTPSPAPVTAPAPAAIGDDDDEDDASSTSPDPDPVPDPVETPVISPVVPAPAVPVVPVYVIEKINTAYSVVTEQEVAQKYRLAPRQLCDYFALTGDSADSIPGLRHVGPKAAVAFIQACGTVEGLYGRVMEGGSADTAVLGQLFREGGVRLSPARVAKSMDSTPLADMLLFKRLVTLNPSVGPVLDILQAEAARVGGSEHMFKLSDGTMKTRLLQAQASSRISMSSSSSSSGSSDSIDISQSFDTLTNIKILLRA